jgi:hypothetical protein
MKKTITPKVQKVRNRMNPEDIYYTWNTWEPKDIDGVIFLPVVKRYPSHSLTQTLHYVKKDNMEYIK